MFERFTRSARIAVVFAQEEAHAQHAEDIRPEHLLLGVVRSAGGALAGVLAGHGVTAEVIRSEISTPGQRTFDDEAAALRAVGIDLHAVRDAADRVFGAGSFDEALQRSGRRRRRRRLHTPLVKPAKKALELALREAVAQKSSVIGCEHVLLGILRSGDETTLALVTRHVAPAVLRADVVALLRRAA